ncbi:ferredoxin-nitrite reductase [Solirubrobacter pauli]|uniref:assimilatory sulfite reductase (ferredoxin) n=1 Tax=Solirubrobacter pauli TaxID=166793 RepID=A0A660KZR9_9ACTN|nr:nitrite/sulfite reductase [Solirubrobacter pauli]RKQ86444.1 ferredoxin-nitrite reductase [Solirubrobacter pauli]
MSKIERIKAETDGLDVLPELLRAAREGWETLSPDHVGLLKWYGLYAHNTGDGHFMLRTKVIQGKLSLEQAEVMAGIAEEFGRGVIDCTTRQCFQIHWIRLEHIPEIFARLDRVGLTSSGACGDITRNVVGCTLSGLAHDEVVDGYATAEAIHEHFLDNKLYSNLPRKYKISVTGCAEDCARGLINDIALSGAIADDGTRGFNLRVGGGLSTQPRFARWMDVFVTPEEAPEVIEGMTGIFRDAEENRKARGKARLKFLVDRVGPEALREELERRVGRPLRRGVPKPPGPGEDHIGVLPQSDDAFRTVGLVVPVGRLKAAQLLELTELARTYGARPDDALRLTHQQNVLLPWIPADKVDGLLLEPLIGELTPTPTLFQRGLQTCTGKEYCGLAKVHTKGPAVEIAKFLDEHVRPNGHGDDFRLHFAGCSSSCAQHQIADVGIEGVLKKVDGEFVEAMDIRIGGRLGPDPKFGDVVIKKVPNWELNDTLLRIFTLYETHHAEGETFRDFAGRTDPQWWTDELTPVEEPVA